MRTLISGPTIGKLCQRTRKWAHENLHRGSFGPVTKGRGGVLYAELEGVERYAGIVFSAEQLVAATARDDKPARLVTVPMSETVEAVNATQAER
jgi:hypothetical protein